MSVYLNKNLLQILYWLPNATIIAAGFSEFTFINNKNSISDIIGITISLICAIQCALAPILLGLLPVIPQWAHFGHSWVWISLIILIAIYSLGRGFLKHRIKKVLICAFIGVGFLLLGALLEGRLTILAESSIFVLGGLMLSYSHWLNYKLLKNCKA